MVELPAGGLRDRRKDQTRRDLQAAALEMFAARGFDHVTVDEIAAACDVSRATIFRYFPTKEDLVVGSEPERLLELRHAFEDRPPDEPVFESIRQSLLALAARYEHERDQLLVASRLTSNHRSLQARALALQAEWTATFAALIAARTTPDPQPDLAAKVLAAAVTAAVQVAVQEWLETDAGSDLSSLLGEAVGLLGTGFGDDVTRSVTPTAHDRVGSP